MTQEKAPKTAPPAELPTKEIPEEKQIPQPLDSQVDDTSTAESVKQSVKEGAKDIKEGAQELLDRAKHAIPSSDDLSEAYNNANAMQQQAREQLERANHVAVTFIQDQPVIALGAAFGIGYFLGSVAARRWII